MGAFHPGFTAIKKKFFLKPRIMLCMELCFWLREQDIPIQLLTQEEYTHWVEGQSIRKACSISIIYSLILFLILKLPFIQSCCLFDLPISPSPSFSRAQISELHTVNILSLWFHCSTPGRQHKSINTRFFSPEVRIRPDIASQHSTPASRYQ